MSTKASKKKSAPKKPKPRLKEATTEKPSGFQRPIRERRPVQLAYRMTKEEDAALWAMHVETRKSRSQLMRELMVEGLQKRGYMDAKKAAEILAKERVIKTSPRPPAI